MNSGAAQSRLGGRASGAVPLLFVLVALAACSREDPGEGPEPFVLPEGDGEPAAPFRGPFAKLDAGPPDHEGTEAEALLGDPLPLPAPPVAEIAAPAEPSSGSEPARRRQTWLNESFRCKAISTTRLRRCRFERTERGHRLSFPVADVTCENVIFDERGDPERLTGCRGAWLRVPAKNRLRPDRERRVWSGSHSGWSWKGDRQPYCCPGLWLEAPESLSH